LLEFLNKVCELGFALASVVLGRCVWIVLSGSASAGLPCYWLVVVIRCRFTRQLVALSF